MTGLVLYMYIFFWANLVNYMVNKVGCKDLLSTKTFSTGFQDKVLHPFSQTYFVIWLGGGIAIYGLL